MDGKTYTHTNQATRQHYAKCVHTLAHNRQLSVRQIVSALADECNIRLSVGSVHSYLTTWTCDGQHHVFKEFRLVLAA